MKKIIVLFVVLFVASAQAQSSRASEDSMFGGTQTPAKAPKDHDKEALDSKSQDAFASGEVIDNPLQIGGTFYQRLVGSSQEGVKSSDDPISMPLQFDLFLDARPSDRVRGFVDERLLYDSTRDSFGNATGGTALGSSQFGSGSTLPSGFNGAPSTIQTNPQTVLDQAWLKFDLERTVFVTVGKQHVKWGTSRFWNPTDLLSTQVRDPLLPYDLRLGNTMIKLAVPWESSKTNFYAITLFDNPQPSSTLGQMGEAFRVEKVIGNGEIGFDAIYRGHLTPVYGADLSTQLGPLDVYLEGTYVTANQYPYYQLQSAGLVPGQDLATEFTATNRRTPIYQVSGGANYSFPWKDNRQATFGMEYFYNGLGYSNSSAYPILIFSGQYQPFYTGRDYAAAYLTLEGPDESKHTSYTLTTLANLSDDSYLSRIDFSWRFLTYLTFEAFVDKHFGARGGEFNFSMNTPAMTYQGNAVPALLIPATSFDLGMALRMSF